MEVKKNKKILMIKQKQKRENGYIQASSVFLETNL
jgi:hypothetical protein